MLILDATVVLSNNEDARTTCDPPVSTLPGGRPSHPSSVKLPCRRHGARPGKALVAPAAAGLLRPLHGGEDVVVRFPAKALFRVRGHGGGSRARHNMTCSEVLVRSSVDGGSAGRILQKARVMGGQRSRQPIL